MITRVLSYVVGRPWAVLPEIAEIMVDVLARRALDDRLTASELAAITGRPPSDASAAGPGRRQEGSGPDGGDVAVLPVYGLMAHRARMVGNLSSPASTSTELLMADLRAAWHDARVSAIVLDVDSPGGAVEGVPELAAEMRRLRSKGSKPIVAVASAMAASAAYWIASQADELVVTPSGQVGSIGVYGLHEDLSKALEAEGRRMTFVSAGKYKVEGNPFEPLSEEAKAAAQTKVDAYYDLFVGDVAKGRGVPVATVRAGFGEGRLVLAKEAVATGMADRLDTLDGVLARLTAGERPERRKGDRAEDEGGAPVAATPTAAPAAGADDDWRRRRHAWRARRASQN